MSTPWISAPHSGVAQTLYTSGGKRLFDLLVSATFLLLLSPCLMLITALVKLTSRGPVFYRQDRVGLSGKTFRIVKFRTMTAQACMVRPGITTSSDSRITGFGGFLRVYKLDELPQLWNVLKGEMSLVGPRPELQRFVDFYTPQQRQVLTVRPGLTDSASLRFWDEEKMLAGESDPESRYLNDILPQKLSLSEEYIERMSFAYDTVIIFRTIFTVLIRPKSI